MRERSQGAALGIGEHDREIQCIEEGAATLRWRYAAQGQLLFWSQNNFIQP